MINSLRPTVNIRTPSNRFRESVHVYGIGSQYSGGAVQPIAASTPVDIDTAFASKAEDEGPNSGLNPRTTVVSTRPDGSRHLSLYA